MNESEAALLRSALDELKLRFRAANVSGSPRKAWLLHIPDKGDKRLPILAVRLDGYQDYGYLRLKPIIEDAVRLLDKLPAAVQTRLWGRPTPETPVVLMSDSDRIPQWVMAVFESLNKSGVGPPLRRVRDLPLDEKPVGFKFPPAAEWYATLPDFAAASVQAIGILQSWLPDVPKRKTEAAADDKSEARIVASIADLLEKPKRATRKTKRPAHRPPDTDTKSDAKIADTWLQKRNSGECRAYNDLAGVLKRDVAEVKEAIDRDRKRRPNVWAANKRKARRKK